MMRAHLARLAEVLKVTGLIGAELQAVDESFKHHVVDLNSGGQACEEG